MVMLVIWSLIMMVVILLGCCSPGHGDSGIKEIYPDSDGGCRGVMEWR